VNNVKKNNLTRGAFAALLLASTVAGADQQYPAADFQPEVLYQDSDYIAKNSPSTAKSSTVKATTNTVESGEVDSRYPAANFQPEVLYHDPNYKPGKTIGVRSNEISSGSVEPESASAAADNKEESSMQNYLIGLIILAGAGFYFFKNQSAATVKKKAPLPARTSYALTGVSKYINKVSGTGVSRYLEKHVKSPSAATGVAKYMAKKSVSAKTTVAKAATGVEKYMRDRG
jgi:hypothetical protein